MSAHARVAPSGFRTIRLCPGSLHAQEGLPDNSSEEAKEGTFAHWVRDVCLKTGTDAWSMIGATKEVEGTEFELIPEMARDIQKGLDFARDLRDSLGGVMYVERRVSCEELIPDCWGTADTAIIAPVVNVVIDLKYGAGIPIDAHELEQLMLYALGFYLEFRDIIVSDEWVLIIDQPRVGQGVSEWRCTTADLLKFAAFANQVVAIAETPGAMRVAGTEQCRFCRARGSCYEFADYILDLFGLTFSSLKKGFKLPDIKFMTPERRSYVLLNSELFTGWLRDLHASALVDANLGLPTPGLKVVHGRRGHRKWSQPDKLVAFLKERMRIDQIYDMKLKSPAQMEDTVLGPKLWKKVNELGWVTQSEAKPALVPITDKREAIAPVTSLFFNYDVDIKDLV